MIISIIVAIDEENGIGKDNTIVWHFPEDMNRFRERTLGKTVIMGRKTHTSIGKRLPQRTNIVVSRRYSQLTLSDPDEICRTLERAFVVAKIRDPEIKEVFVIGGQDIYNQTLPMAHRIYMTRIPGKYDCDTHFPKLGPEWVETVSLDGRAGVRYVTYERTPLK